MELLRFPVRYDIGVGALLAWDSAGARLAVGSGEGLTVLHMGRSEPVVLGDLRARAIAWSPAGDTVAAASDDRDLQRLLRVADGVEIWRASIGEAAVDEVSWSLDGRRIAFVGDEVVVCDAANGAVLWRRGETRTRPVTSVASLPEAGRIRVVERVRNEEDRVFPSAAQWSPDGRFLVACWEGVFRVLDAHDGEVKAEGSLSRGVVRWTTWGEAVFEDGESRLGRCVLRVDDHWARDVTFSRDGRLAAAEGREHRLWVQDENGIRAIDGHPRTIEALSWSARGVLATACRDGAVRRLPRSDGELEVWARLAVKPKGLSWSPDGAYLAAYCADAVVVLSELTARPGSLEYGPAPS